MLTDLVVCIYLLFNDYYYLSFILLLNIIYKLLINLGTIDNLELKSSNEYIPKRGTNLSAGIDIPCVNNFTIKIGERLLIDSGIKIKDCPENTYLRIAPRSGLSLRGIDIGAGVVDRDYKGELKVLVINNGRNDIHFNQGDYIAQLILEKIHQNNIIINGLTIDDKKYIRNDKGFGSTDKKT